MAIGYLVTLGNNSLDVGDSISATQSNFTINGAAIGSGSWTWSGVWDGGGTYNNITDTGTYYTGSDGNVYFIPTNWFTTSGTASATTAPAYTTPIVSGTAGNDLIDSTYTGDPQGDKPNANANTIQAGAGNDTVNAGSGNDSIDGGTGNDIIDAGAGNDTIVGGLGDDTVYGSGGNDSISGNDGNDVLYGDNPVTAPATTETLSWIGQGATGTNIAGGFTQDTGGIRVTAAFTNNGGNTGVTTTNSTQYVGTGGYATNSGLSLTGGAGPNVTATLTFNSEVGNGLTDQVSNVNFIINDIDMSGWQDIVTVNAYDANGNPVAVTLTPYGNDTVSGNTITAANTSDTQTQANGAVQVTIAGPVHSVEIIYSNGGTVGQALWVTNVNYTTIPATDGNDTIDGGNGNDFIYGGGGNDSILGGTGLDTIYGGTGNDVIDSGAENDLVYGGDGNDSIIGGTGVDRLYGDNGNDRIDGGADNDSIFGGAGNDSIQGGAGTDSLYGGDGDDIIDDSGATADYFEGGAGNDIINAGAGNDVAYGGTGTDSLFGNDGDDILYGDAGDDYVDGDAGNDTLYGGEGNDTIVGDDGNDRMFGGIGDDGIYATSGNNYAEGGDGNDSIFMGTGNDTVFGGNNNDSIYGGAGNDVLNGDAGNDRLEGGTGSDRIILGNGFGTDTIDGSEDAGNTDVDILDGATLTTATTVTMSGPEAGTLTTGTNTATFSNIEQIVTGSGADSITGSAGADTITTGAGADRINAGAGNDQINLGAGTATDGAADVVVLQDGSGNDIIRGFDAPTGSGTTFTGIDTLDVSNLFDLPAGNAARTPVRTNDVTVTDDGAGNAVLTFPNGESVTLVGITPAAAANPFYLQAIGIPMPDGTVEGTAGNDIIDASYTGDPDGDRVDGNDAILPGDTGNDDLIYGYGGNDTISAGNGDDEVYGGTGNDVLLSGTGNDTLFGGDGNDQLFSENGDDTVYGGAGDDTVYASLGSDLVYGGDGNDVISGGGYAFESDTLFGDAGEDSISGGLGDDIIFGGADNDTLNGDAGADSIEGGAGDDTIILDNGFGNDTIIGGETGETTGDVINGSGLTENVTVDFAGPEAGTISNGIDTATFSEIEQIVTGSGDDTITGGAGNENVITGAGNDTVTTTGTGSDTISTGAGNDTITFSEGDSIDGGTGDDTFIAENLGEATNGTITIAGGSGGETANDNNPLTLEGDTLQLGTLADLSTLNITSTTVNADGNTSYAGSVTMDDGTILNFSEIENIICFTPGTRIATPRGARDIATLKVGDLVVTRDHGLQPIRWIQQRTVPAMDRFAPIRIRPGVVIGQERDLLVSPQHRMMFQGYRAELLFGESEVLVSAKHLIDGKYVTQDEGGCVTYIHMMFDEHEVVYAEGAATESFHPGDVGLTAISDPAREELFALFPELRTNANGYGQTARRCLKKHESELLIL